MLKHLGKVEVGNDEVIMKRLFNSPHPEPFPGDHHASMGDHIKASYVHCAVGNYCEHVSGCEPAYAKKPRPASWNEHWAQEWTHGGQPREKVDARTVCNIDLDPACMDKLVWKSFWENEPCLLYTSDAADE